MDRPRPITIRSTICTAAVGAILAAAGGGAALGQVTRTWTNGAGDRNWFTPGNWSPAGVPQPVDTVIINSCGVSCQNGQATLNADATVRAVNLTGGGFITGSGTLTITQGLTGSGDTITGTGVTRLASTSVVTQSGGFSVRRPLEIGGSWDVSSSQGFTVVTSAPFTGRVTVLQGATVTFTLGGTLFMGGTGTSRASVVNRGTINVQNGSGTISGFVDFSNAGLLSVNFVGFSIQPPAANADITAGVLGGGGTWTLLQGGLSQNLGQITAIGPGTTLSISGATGSVAGLTALARVDGTLQLGLGAVLSTTPANGVLTNAGRIVLGGVASSLTRLGVTGGYVQTAAGTLREEVTGLAAFGSLQVNGPAQIDGGLEVRYVPPYSPTGTGIWTPISSTGLSGNFARVCTDERVNGVAAKAVYASTLQVQDRTDGSTAVQITSQPATIAGGCPPSPSPFTVGASGGGLSYRWRKDGVPLPTGFSPKYQNSVTAATLLVFGPTSADNGAYDCVITNACSSATSAAASLARCRADFDCQNGVDLLDIFAFLDAWFAGAFRADFDGQNGVDLLDIFAFLEAWFAGC